jgi:chloramphenicol 3-O-phosphotransferase
VSTGPGSSTSGRIIFLNGASSSGKSTLALGLQQKLDEPFWHYSIDHLLDSKVLPMERMKRGDFVWSEWREHFFDGFHRTIPVLAKTGNNLIVEHNIETKEWISRLVALLGHLDGIQPEGNFQFLSVSDAARMVLTARIAERLLRDAGRLIRMSYIAVLQSRPILTSALGGIFTG